MRSTNTAMAAADPKRSPHAAHAALPRPSPAVPAMPAAPPAVELGVLVALADHGCSALVRLAHPGGYETLDALTLAELHDIHVGCRVAVSRMAGGKALVLGVVRDGAAAAAAPQRVGLVVDGQRLAIHATQQLELSCGNARISLTKDGRIVIRGTQVISHADGVNRVRGGSVQLN